MEPEGRTGRGNRGEVTSEGKWGGRELLDGAPGVSDAPALRLIVVFWLPARCSRDRDFVS